MQLKPQNAETIAQYALFCAQFNGWNGGDAHQLRAMDMYPNGDEPDGWHDELLKAQAWINEHIFFEVNPGDGKRSVLWPVNVNGVAAADQDEEFPRDGSLPAGCITAQVRGVASAVPVIAEATDEDKTARFEAGTIEGATFDQMLFEAIIACGKRFAIWYAWGMFLTIIDRAPRLERGTEDNPVTVTPEWVKYWALRSGGRRIKRRIGGDAGKALYEVIEAYRKSLPVPDDEWDRT